MCSETWRTVLRVRRRAVIFQDCAIDSTCVSSSRTQQINSGSSVLLQGGCSTRTEWSGNACKEKAVIVLFNSITVVVIWDFSPRNVRGKQVRRRGSSRCCAVSSAQPMCCKYPERCHERTVVNFSDRVIHAVIVFKKLLCIGTNRKTNRIRFIPSEGNGKFTQRMIFGVIAFAVYVTCWFSRWIMSLWCKLSVDSRFLYKPFCFINVKIGFSSLNRRRWDAKEVGLRGEDRGEGPSRRKVGQIAKNREASRTKWEL